MSSNEHMPPEDLARLNELVEAVCNEQRVARRSAAADLIAKRVRKLYLTGERDRSAYLALCIELRTKGDVEVHFRGSKPH